MDNMQLIQALLAQAQGIKQPGVNQAQIKAMMDQAAYSQAQAQNQRSIRQPVSHSGAQGAAAQWGRDMLAGKREKESLSKLEEAYNAQSGLDQYAAQMQDIQGQLKALMEEQRRIDAMRMVDPNMNPGETFLRGTGQTDMLPPEPKDGRTPLQKNTEWYNSLTPEQRAIADHLQSGGGGKTPAYRDFVGDDGATYTHVMNPDGSMGERVGKAKVAPSSDNEASGKDLDINEALGVLAEAKEALKNIPNFSGTGPIQGHVMMFSEWNQNFQALQDRLFAVAKRIYKTKGEGQFSDADARALAGMLFSNTRNEAVNLQIIESLEKSLVSRSPSFQKFQAEMAALGVDPGTDDSAAGEGAESVVHINHETGEKIRWDGTQWVTVQ